MEPHPVAEAECLQVGEQDVLVVPFGIELGEAVPGLGHAIVVAQQGANEGGTLKTADLAVNYFPFQGKQQPH